MKTILAFLFLFLLAACSTTNTETTYGKYCGQVYLDEYLEDKDAAHCFYDNMVDCSPAKLDVVLGQKGFTTTYSVSIVKQQETECILRMDVIETEKNATSSGVALLAGGNPYVGEYVICTYTRSKQNRIENNDYPQAIYLPTAMYTKAKEGKCSGPLVKLWENDRKRAEAFENAIKTLKESDCNQIVEENFRQDCKTTINAINNKNTDLCENIEDIDMKFVCTLNTITR